MTQTDFELINANDEVFQDAVGIKDNSNDLKKVEKIYKTEKIKNELINKICENKEPFIEETIKINLSVNDENENQLKKEEIFSKKDSTVDQNSNLLVDEGEKKNFDEKNENLEKESKDAKEDEVKEEKTNECIKTDINDNLEDVIKTNKINDELNLKSGLNFEDIKFRIEKNVENLRVENKDLSFEECLENGRQMMIKFVDNKFEEILDILEHQSNISIIHKLGAAAVRFFDSILSMDKEKMALALVSMKEAAEYADVHRKKTSYLNYLFSPDYNSFSDIECHAELCYATSQLVSGLLIALEDQSVYGFVNGGLKIRMAYSAFRECYNILKHKLNWDSNVARMHFESGTRLGIGAFDLIISFFPSKLAKLLEYIGFNSDRDLAIEELTAAVNLVDGLYYDISSILLSSYYGFLEYFYGLGESDTNFFDKSAKIWQQRTPNSSVVKIGFGVREMLLGQPDKAIKYFKECVEGQTYWLQLHFACSWEICWSYVMKSDWDNAAKYAETLKNQCKWSPAMFTYLYAVFLFMEMEEKNKPELAEKISNELRKIPKLKRKIGGKRAFHEKIVIERSKKFHDNIHNWLLPPLELLYIWNIFHMMAKEPKLLKPTLDNVETKLKTYVKSNDVSKKLDQYCYLIFMKGVIKRHLNQKDEAIKLFQEVISCKKRIKDETHLLPQSCFEIGMIYRENNKFSEAKKWLKKAKDDYSDYLTESMIQYRVVWALDLIRKKNQSINK